MYVSLDNLWFATWDRRAQAYTLSLRTGDAVRATPSEYRTLLTRNAAYLNTPIFW